MDMIWMDNLNYLLHQNIPGSEEVSISWHALVADVLYLGLEETIKGKTSVKIKL